jgi:hypothetical protein
MMRAGARIGQTGTFFPNTQRLIPFSRVSFPLSPVHPFQQAGFLSNIPNDFFIILELNSFQFFLISFQNNINNHTNLFFYFYYGECFASSEKLRTFAAASPLKDLGAFFY